ncbi:MAG TPA: dienelactone hydrolase family protein [Caulobacteraceae bacterium]|nr:dienelactone hydrolase family protein [Caulobacteraceae bacterium]
MATRDIEYRVEGRRYVGSFVAPDGVEKARPGVLVAPEGMGLVDLTRTMGARLAEAGYAALAMDYYGGGKPLQDRNEVMARLGPWMRDPTGIRAIAATALGALAAQSEVDSARLAAIGFCWGGTTALELARAGAQLKAAVGFHCGLETAAPAKAGDIKARVLALIGAQDPLVGPGQRLAFEQEMDAAGADWRLVLFGGAGHSYTNPIADTLGMPGFAYDERTDQRAWRAMLDLFAEAL